MASLQALKPLSELATKQKRLRHLRTIVARNLNIRSLTEDTSHIAIFYTLHNIKSRKVFYESEKISGSMNPTWRSMNLAQGTDEDACMSMTCFHIKLWLDEPGKSTRLLMSWTIDLTGLEYVSDKIKYDGSTYEKNTVLFGLHNGFYGAPPSEETVEKYRNVDIQQCVSRVDMATVKHSYTTSSLLRIQTVLRAIKQTRVVVSKVRSSIEERLGQSQRATHKLSQRELLVLKVRQLRQDLEWRTMQLQCEKENFEIQQTATNSKDADINTKFETLQKDKDRLQEKKKGYFEIREELIKTSAQLVMRRKQLISELAFIYPISEVSNNDYAICDVKLPNSENFAGQDEVMIAIALGYTSHLIQMISHFLDVPVRYAMEHRGSRSRIRDHIHDKLTDKERDFPLYSKGKEKFQFNYGVYLMNKNIAQLRYYCGLGTTDLRLTLSNLKSLLELRLGVKYDASTGTFIMTPNQPQLSGTENISRGTEAIPPIDDQSSADKAPSDTNSDLEILLPNSKTEESDLADQPAVFKKLEGTDLFKPSADNFFQIRNSSSFTEFLSDKSSIASNGQKGLMTTSSNGIGAGSDHSNTWELLKALNEQQTDSALLSAGFQHDNEDEISNAFETEQWKSEVTNSNRSNELKSDYHVALQEPTFVVGDSHESLSEHSSSTMTGTFKTRAMFSHVSVETEDEIQSPLCSGPMVSHPQLLTGTVTHESAIEERTAMLSSNAASFKFGLSAKESDSTD